MIHIVIINNREQETILIKSLLSSQDDFEITGMGRDDYDALKLVSALQPDVAILDLRLETIGGMELTPLIKRRSPATAVILLAMPDDEKLVYAAINSGVSGYLLKNSDMDRLVPTIRIVHKGGCYISTGIAAGAFPDTPELVQYRDIYQNFLPLGEDNFVPSTFSRTELQILGFISEGQSNKEIAENLRLTIGTIRNCISTVMHKTGLHNRVQMAIYAFRNGLNHPVQPCPAKT
jgi:DNA-binding NarL/FixJ family response regulator